ncbi:type 1 glutamine amidotransferase domain-containing protein [Ornithobacterium rhinotracheale]|uniref:Type 1 glutamine amidotransferase domain-containing protein n=1 Tax=Ornithobacterium rhinotracheale TaxID=28251 RepID=A0A3R5UW20_ORNRH|nr:type 1 glutamine amidotransferase domain-containing protein [Ornithobacterium rhinotracheale]QAR31077.1 type 1 glutamine amidotransferase domain-containing protein [Ornithobacterium rhinotracheale]
MNILLIATSVDKYPKSQIPTGLWLSELTHFYEVAEQANCNISIASPKGGEIPIDPESLKPMMMDKLTRNYWKNPDFRKKLNQAQSLQEVANQSFEIVYLAGGHGAVFDFLENRLLEDIIVKHWEENKKVAEICHGVGGLLNVKLANGTFLIKGKKLTGFNWFEELIARRRKLVPFNLEEALKKRGTLYEKALIPMTSKVVVDGNLITGQNPFSSKEMANVLKNELKFNL